MIGGRPRLSVLIQSKRDGTCHGFEVVGVGRPVRLLVAGDSERSERRLAGALRARLATLGHEVRCAEMPCGCELREDCLADSEPETRNLLAWIATEEPPSVESTELASEWLARPDHEAVGLIPPGARHDSVLPADLRRFGAIELGPDADVAASQVMGFAGVMEPDQRIFISYSHRDGTEIAHALFRLLTEARFQVFLDAFSLAPGLDFAERIEHELLDRAFLLLVETPAADVSKWVGREVAFARRHRLGLAAVNLDGKAPLTKGIGNSRRREVAAGSLEPGAEFSPPVARDLLEFVLARHGEAMLRRRGVLRVDLETSLGALGVPRGNIRPAPGGLEVEAGARYAVSMRPRPAGLLDMHGASRRAPHGWNPVMVSATPGGAPERTALEWLAETSGVPHRDEGNLRGLAAEIKAGKVS